MNFHGFQTFSRSEKVPFKQFTIPSFFRIVWNVFGNILRIISGWNSSFLIFWLKSPYLHPKNRDRKVAQNCWQDLRWIFKKGVTKVLFVLQKDKRSFGANGAICKYIQTYRNIINVITLKKINTAAVIIRQQFGSVTS